MTLCKEDQEYLVFGYVSKIESKLSTQIIPIAIKYICLRYYLIIKQFGDHGSFIKLNENQNIAHYIGNSGQWNTVYGTNVIDPGNKHIKKYKWKLKLLNFDDHDRNGFYIGIDSSNKKFVEQDFTVHTENTNPFYAFTLTGYGWQINKEHDLMYAVLEPIMLYS